MSLPTREAWVVMDAAIPCFEIEVTGVLVFDLIKFLDELAEIDVDADDGDSVITAVNRGDIRKHDVMD